MELDSVSGSLTYESALGLQFDELEARVNGLMISGRATLALGGATASADGNDRSNPPGSSTGLEPAASPPVATGSLADASGASTASPIKLLNNLLQLESQPGQEPHLTFDAIIDPSRSTADIPGLSLKGSFEGADFTWHGRQIDAARFDVTFEDGLLEVGRLQFDGLGGSLEASGRYDQGSEQLTIPALTSTIDLTTLKRELALELPAILEAIEFTAAPSLDIEEFDLQLGEPITGSGKIRLGADGGFTIREGEDSITAEHFQLAMAWSGPQVLSVERATGRVGNLEFDLAGSLRWDKPAAAPDQATQALATPPPDIPRAIPVNPVPPSENRPEKPPSLVRRLKEYLTVDAKSDPLKIVGQFTWDARARHQPTREWYERLTFDTEVTGSDYEWREFSVRRSVGKIALRNATLEFLPFNFETANGTIESRASYELATQRLRMASLQLTIDPIRVINQLGLPIARNNGKIKILGSPSISGKDILLDFADTQRSSGTLDVSKADGIAVLTRTGREARLSNVRGQLVFADGVIETRAVTAEFLKGRARFDLRMDRNPADPSYKVEVTIDDISIAAVNDWLDPSDPMIEAGTLDLRFEGNGSNSVDSLSGNGRATIDSDSHAAQGVPIVSDLVGALEGFFPILRRNSGWDFDMPFSVGGGKIKTTNTRLTSERIQASISGSVDWINDEVDLVAGVNLRGLVGVVANIARPFKSGFANFNGRGPINKVQWEPAKNSERQDEPDSRRTIIPRIGRDR